jgi:hypothetical protein
MPCWWINHTPMNKQLIKRRSADWLPAKYESGRNAERKQIYGKISGRANVGFEEEDWCFLVSFSKTIGISISDTIRGAVTTYRKDCEADCPAEPDKVPYWMKEDWNDPQ